ncbi:hypothetical protein PR202_ga06866 [Eleusine coracana subsp. coracana]|uniref:Glycosyltransferase N-terminal domain-containing protein n=1 Tax=Eleusine coracana subsp. coracana TaxID=191504 RepID=A0AAV5BW28_ELECO|nr:hypothetical protein QOZ80_2AG0105730 [Eleusine coracana subsp. coracana]GJM90571.1 hypothetical protein PR202_ga06866 [Eleusine coracana subsp. coracana]
MSTGGGVASTGPAPHFVLVPMMAAGHTGPMLDLARVLASRGVLVTLVTTPLNLPRLTRALADATALPIRFLPLRFPCAEAGLPDGCESADAIPTHDLLKNFHSACAMLGAPLLDHLTKKAHPSPTCIVSDTCHPWTGPVARELGVPRLAFDCFCAFSSFCMRLMSFHGIFDGVDDDHRPVRVPGFPIDFELSRARSPGNFTGFGKEFADAVMAENARADGLVLNSFAELEPLFVGAYEAAIGKKVWTVGPLFLATNPSTKASTEDGNAVRCSRWLESKQPRSVVLVSFGSLVRSSLPQLVEIAHGMEATNRPFIWAVKPGNDAAFELWLAEDGFEARVGERGLVVRGWAPQTAVLSHPATAAFVTHCGWNSVLECVAAGLPMVTWPHFAEQFMNEKLVVDVLRVGVTVGVKDAALWGVETEDPVAATRQDVERAVAAVMDGGEEARARRDRADELGRKAREAVVDGGSSCRSVELLVQHVEQKKFPA